MQNSHRLRSLQASLLITDVVMPQVNGKELADRLLAANPDLGVVFTSGYPPQVSLDGELDSPRVAFIQKPYAVNALVACARAVLESIREWKVASK